MPSYRFTDDWFVATDPQTAHGLLRRIEGWPRWWPSSMSVQRLASQDSGGAGEAYRSTFQTRLPYRMSFQADVVHEDPLAVEVRVVGLVQGQGRWQVDRTAEGSRVHFDWVVEPKVRWMRLLSPVARPVFVWNHESLMAKAARAFADELGVAMPRPPDSTPPAALAAAHAVAGLAVLAGLALLARQATSRPRRRPSSTTM